MPAERPLRDGQPAGYALIETMRYQPGTGVVRAKLHLDRLRRSADALGFAYPRAAINSALAALDTQNGMRRVRLELSAGADVSVVAEPFALPAPGLVWRLAIADTRIDPSDPLVFHKTTRRGRYEAARAEFPRDRIDEIVLLNGDGHLCEGTMTSLFLRVENGPLLTPRLSCGLLPGVLRAEMLASGVAVEADLPAEMLFTAREIRVGNSLRGLVQARIDGS